ncbi:MAG: class I adenylate-forming enzyme family protein [Candidatus Dormibacteraceae bacterium]
MRPSIAERRAALAAVHRAWEPGTFATHLRRTVARFGDRPAVITDARTLTYDDLWREARAVARGLVKLGVEPGEHVAMVVANQPEFVVLQYGVACAGAVCVPFNFRLREEELGYVLEQSNAVCLITMDRFGNSDYLAMLDHLAPGWATHPEGGFPRLRQVVTFITEPGAEPRQGALDLAGLVRLGEDVDEREIDRRSELRKPLDVACVMYTSGTTGFSKGAMLTHDSMLRCGYAAAMIRAFEDGRRILFSLPLYHVFAYCEGMLAVTWVGGAIIPQLQFDGEKTFADIERHRPQEALFVPTMALALVEHPARTEHDLSSVYAVMTASAPAPVRLWEQVRTELGIEELVTAYGQTEATASTTYTMPDDPLELASVTVGRPKQGGIAADGAPEHMVTRYKTIDPVTGEDVPDGEEGELAVSGPQLMLGYYEKPEDTAAAFLPGGWLKSGDLGRIRPDGYLALTGRSKELYKRGAELVAPREIETLLDRRRDVLQSYVVGIPDERMGEVGWAFVVPVAGSHPTEEELLADCKEHLARFKVPEKVVFIRSEDLPLTGSGKVQKFKLAQRVAGQGQVSTS